jgi:hypothetical protein
MDASEKSKRPSNGKRLDHAFITGSWRFQHRRALAATVIEGP